MMKKSIISILILSMFIHFTAAANAAYVSEGEYHRVIHAAAQSAVSSKRKTVTRGECIVAILRILGVDDEAADDYAGATYDQTPFLDLMGDDLDYGYIRLAKFENIGFGVRPTVEYANIFDADRPVTVKECLTFMLRGLKGSDNVNWNTVAQDSIDIGLYNVETYMLNMESQLLSANEFYTLLHSMLNMKRYLYWPGMDWDEGAFSVKMQIDSGSGMRYIDWILDEKII